MNDEIRALEKELLELKSRLSDARRRARPEPVPDLSLRSRDGSPVSLSSLFGTRDEMLVIHNMGKRCTYCTLWADGLLGFLPHLTNRSALVLVSEDEPATLDAFARSRGWTFPVASMHGTEFAKALGVETEPGHTYPGVSALRRTTSGGIERTGFAAFGPGDDFCSVWAFLDLFAKGANGWEPKLKYA